MTVLNVYDTWLALQQLVNVQQNGQIPPSVFNTWYNEVNKQVFKELAEQFQLNQVMSDLLSPFQSIKLIPVTPQSGQNWGLLSAPSDYQYFTGANILTQKQEDECFSNSNLSIIDNGGYSQKYTDPDFAKMAQVYAGANIEEGQCQLVDTSRWASCLSHYTKGATLKAPKMVQFQSGFKVAPKGVVSILLYYLHTPAEAVFSYTISAQDIAIYDSANSKQVEWSDQVLPMFLPHLVIKYGLYINNPDVVKMGENMLMAVKSK